MLNIKTTFHHLTLSWKLHEYTKSVDIIFPQTSSKDANGHKIIVKNCQIKKMRHINEEEKSKE